MPPISPKMSSSGSAARTCATIWARKMRPPRRPLPSGTKRSSRSNQIPFAPSKRSMSFNRSRGRVLPGHTVAILFVALASIGALGKTNPVGLWKSEGYGLFLRIDPSRVTASEITSISCLPAWTAVRDLDQHTAWVFHGGFASGDEVFRIYPGGSLNTAILRRSDDMAAMVLHRVTSPPVPCIRPAEDTPPFNYDVLWTTFQENYP